MTQQDESYPERFFQREDPSDDARFYDWPRKVVHIDEGAIAALRATYEQLLPRSGAVLDLMSSWRSHLPTTLANSSDLEVTGLGMNAEEMADNPQLSRYVIHDLNRDPCLPFPDDAFDGAMCAVSVQYLTRPLEVFRDVARVVKPSGPFLISISNRCFPTKAVAIWQSSTDEQHVRIVASYFESAGGWNRPESRAYRPSVGDPLYVVWARSA